jgi:hypothetical protein
VTGRRGPAPQGIVPFPSTFRRNTALPSLTGRALPGNAPNCARFQTAQIHDAIIAYCAPDPAGSP